MAKSVRLAILSDLHAFSPDARFPGSGPSWLNLSKDQSNPQSNPFAGLFKLIEESDGQINADLVICCGDMGDKASPEGQQYVWRQLQSLKDKLGAEAVIGTVGNHDMDSRFQNSDHDARGQVQGLRPLFPISAEQQWLEYWAKNYTFFDFEDLRFVLLNSAAYHGYQDPKKDTPEYEHGRISDRTLDSLISDLEKADARPANILVCHHHPVRNNQIPIPEYSEMQNGDRLLNRLMELKRGPWLILHGHKHVARLIHAQGPNIAPVIFSAGSFAAKLPAEFDGTRNEFYLMDVEVPENAGASSSVRGAVSTWVWHFGNKWRVPKASEGLGPRVGFGARLDVAKTAHEIRTTLLAKQAGSFVSWEDVCAAFPDLPYLVPEDLSDLVENLKTYHGVKVLHEDERIVQLQVAT